jgi:hypothetical protein
MNRAGGGAVSAGLTSVLADMAGFLPDFYLEMPLFTLDIFHFTVGEKLYVRILSHGDQFRRKDTGGAIVGGEGLVELGHTPTDARLTFDEIDLVTRFRQVQRSLNSGYSASDDKSRTYYVLCFGHSIFTFRQFLIL